MKFILSPDHPSETVFMLGRRFTKTSPTAIDVTKEEEEILKNRGIIQYVEKARAQKRDAGDGPEVSDA